MSEQMDNLSVNEMNEDIVIFNREKEKINQALKACSVYAVHCGVHYNLGQMSKTNLGRVAMLT